MTKEKYRSWQFLLKPMTIKNRLQEVSKFPFWYLWFIITFLSFGGHKRWCTFRNFSEDSKWEGNEIAVKLICVNRNHLSRFVVKCQQELDCHAKWLFCFPFRYHFIHQILIRMSVRIILLFRPCNSSLTLVEIWSESRGISASSMLVDNMGINYKLLVVSICLVEPPLPLNINGSCWPKPSNVVMDSRTSRFPCQRPWAADTHKKTERESMQD